MWWYWPMALVLCLTIGRPTLSQITEKPFSLTCTEAITCERDGRPGECTHYSLCDDNYTMILPSTSNTEEPGSFRSKCPGQYDWCCFIPTAKQIADRALTAGPDVCLLVKELDDCPWCVALYHRKRQRGHSHNGLYCAGTLVGTRAVLTTRSCVSPTVNQSNVMVQVNQVNHQRLPVKDYQQGVYYNDIEMVKYGVGLLLMKEDIVSSTGGACLYRSVSPPSPTSECSAYGYGPDKNGNYFETVPRRTRLSFVTEGKCNASSVGGARSTLDICAPFNDTNDCSISLGSPIVCDGKVVGLMTVAACRYKRSRLKNMAISLWESNMQDWLHATLKALGVPREDYISLH